MNIYCCGCEKKVKTVSEPLEKDYQIAAKIIEIIKRRGVSECDNIKLWDCAFEIIKEVKSNE